MPFQPKENMTIAPVCRRDDIIKMTDEERKEFIKKIDDLVLNDTNKV